MKLEMFIPWDGKLHTRKNERGTRTLTRLRNEAMFPKPVASLSSAVPGQKVPQAKALVWPRSVHIYAQKQA